MHSLTTIGLAVMAIAAQVAWMVVLFRVLPRRPWAAAGMFLFGSVAAVLLAAMVASRVDSPLARIFVITLVVLPVLIMTIVKGRQRDEGSGSTPGR